MITLVVDYLCCILISTGIPCSMPTVYRYWADDDVRTVPIRLGLEKPCKSPAVMRGRATTDGTLYRGQV
jgi:hypothetical protein